MIAIPKPEPRRRTKARKARRETAVKVDIRARVGERDGDCRIGNTTDVFGPCEGVSEWAHLGDSRRFKTRGQAPETRHTTSGTCRLCTKHHRMYDVEKSITIEGLTDKGADSTLRIQGGGVSVLAIPPSGN